MEQGSDRIGSMQLAPCSKLYAFFGAALSSMLAALSLLSAPRSLLLRIRS